MFRTPRKTLAALIISITASHLAMAAPGMELAGSYTTGLASGDGDLTSGETSAVAGNRLFVTNASDVSVDIVGIADPANPRFIKRVDLSRFGSSVTSVAASPDGLVAVGLVGVQKTDRGRVVFLSRSGFVRAIKLVGPLPDMLTFTPDGSRLLVANEGEPDCYGPGCKDPRGSVSVIDMDESGRPASTSTLSFAGLRRGDLPAGVRIFGPGASVAQDLEPESLTVSDDGTRAWVTLQENNAVAALDLESLTVSGIVGLGTKDHGADGNGMDASDKDGVISIAPRERVRGMYMPDAIAQFSAAGKTYLLTANEGDAREYDHPLDASFNFAEEIRAKSLATTQAGVADIPGVSSDTALGRLTVTQFPPSGDNTNLYSFGARSVTLWDADTGAMVWDSGDGIEQLIAERLPLDFNKSNDSNSGFDSRSDNKGPEPEGVVVGEVNGTLYAFVGLERIGGVVVYDLSNPEAPVFAEFLINRDFSTATVGPDSGPEILTFISADKSPNGKAMLLVSNEITGTVSLWQPGQ